MICFACPSCGVKLNARDEYAGRSRNCPKCRSLLVVPQAERAVVESTLIEDPKPEFANIPGPGTFSVEAVGESHYQDVLESITGGRTEESANLVVTAHMVLEDGNPYDNLAVRVEIDGKTVGYLSRDDARSYRRAIARAGCPRVTGICQAMIVGGWEREDDRGHFGVRIDILKELPGGEGRQAKNHKQKRSGEPESNSHAKAQPHSSSSKPFELKGDRLGMGLDDFKSKYHRSADCGRPAE